jgi:hypothetical protein
MAHLLAVPPLATPTAALGVDDAGTAAAATWVFFHVQLLVVASLAFYQAPEF